jgi:hypothetical protein
MMMFTKINYGVYVYRTPVKNMNPKNNDTQIDYVLKVYKNPIQMTLNICIRFAFINIRQHRYTPLDSYNPNPLRIPASNVSTSNWTISWNNCDWFSLLIPAPLSATSITNQPVFNKGVVTV